jgi:S1-C subfamily serine protease
MPISYLSAMKFCHLLLSIASLWLVQTSPSISIPIPVPLPAGIGSSQTTQPGNRAGIPIPVPTPINIPPQTTTQPFSKTGVSKPTLKINVYQLVNPAVVTVYSDEIGSGSIVSASGLILTVNHVVEGTFNGRVSVKTATGKSYRGRVVAVDRLNDLALVQCNFQQPLPTVQLATAPLSIQPGEKVYAIGSPFGRSGTISEGSFRKITRRGDLQTTPGLLEPGNSGGPLLNDRGKLIGVNKGLLDDNSGLATSVLVVKHFIAQNSRSLSLASKPVRTPR